MSDLGAVRLPIGCQGQTHVLEWADGVLSTPAHPDADRERALSALGGAPAQCLRIADAWRRHRDDLDVLMLASRGPADVLTAEPPTTDLPHHRHGGSFGWTSYRPLTSRTPTAYSSNLSRHMDAEEGSGADDLTLVLTLGGGLPERLVADVVATWAERLDDGLDLAEAGPALDAALYGRVRPALRGWLGRPVEVDLRMVPADAPRALTWDGDRVQAELPFRWLTEVWVNGLTVLLDRFTLGASTRDGVRRMSTVGRDLARPTTLTLSG